MLAEEMKLRFAICAILFGSLLIFASTSIAYAQWDAISSGYALTTDWHGQDGPIGQSVTATAGTTDNVVKAVEFRWLDPSGNVVWNPDIPVFGPYTTPDVPDNVTLPQEVIDWANDNPGVSVWYAQNTQIPNVLGDWAVQAIFHNPGKVMRGKNCDMVCMRAPSLHVIPEVPFGTIAILLSMFGALGVFAIKRKRSRIEMPS